MSIHLPPKHEANHQSEAPCTHSYYPPGNQEISTTRICSAVERLHRGAIEGDNEHGPTTVRGSRHTIRIEPICCQRNTYISSLHSFHCVTPVKIFPCFSIGWMYHLLRTVAFAVFMPCHPRTYYFCIMSSYTFVAYYFLGVASSSSSSLHVQPNSINYNTNL